jgi:hypothetical protein
MSAEIAATLSLAAAIGSGSFMISKSKMFAILREWAERRKHNGLPAPTPESPTVTSTSRQAVSLVSRRSCGEVRSLIGHAARSAAIANVLTVLFTVVLLSRVFADRIRRRAEHLTYLCQGRTRDRPQRTSATFMYYQVGRRIKAQDRKYSRAPIVEGVTRGDGRLTSQPGRGVPSGPSPTWSRPTRGPRSARRARPG